MRLLFYSAAFDWRCNISPDVSLSHKLTSIPLWWTNSKCLKIALAKCQCYHSHGVHQKTNVYMCVTLCRTHFKRWSWSVIFLLPTSLSSGLHVMLNWRIVSSGLLHLVPGQHKPCVLMVWTHLSLAVPQTQSSVGWVGQGLPSAQPCGRRGAGIAPCAAVSLSLLGLCSGDTSPAAGGEPWASLWLCDFLCC